LDQRDSQKISLCAELSKLQLQEFVYEFRKESAVFISLKAQQIISLLTIVQKNIPIHTVSHPRKSLAIFKDKNN